MKVVRATGRRRPAILLSLFIAVIPALLIGDVLKADGQKPADPSTKAGQTTSQSPAQPTPATPANDLLSPPVDQPIRGMTSPALSPDGKTLCFTYKGNLWTVPSSGGLASRLTVHEGFDNRPRWSPDGKWIAFDSNRTGNTDVFLIPAEGGSPRQVTTYGLYDVVCDWTPDGQKLLFYSIRDTDGFLYHAYTTPSPLTNLFTVDLHTLALKRLTEDEEPIVDGAFSSNGKLLAYRRSGQPTNRAWYRGSEAASVVVKDLATGNVKTLLKSNAQQFFPFFSSDNRSVYITTLYGNSNTPNLWRVPLAGGEPKQITKYATDAVRSPMIAHNGSLITYLYNGDIYTVKPDGSDAKKVSIILRTDEKVNNQQRQVLTSGAESTQISPDGKQIALVLKSAIWLIPAGGGDAKRLTPQDGSYGDIAWSPDSTKLAVISDKGNQVDVYTLDVKTKALTRLTNDEAMENDTQWSPDGKYVSFNKAGPQAGLYIAPANGDAPARRVAEGNGNNLNGQGIAAHSWSPDSKWIAFARKDRISTIDVWVVPTVGGNPVNVTRYPGINTDPQFTRDGRRLLFASNRNNTAQMYQIPLETPDDRPVEAGAQKQVPDRSHDVKIDFEAIQNRARAIPGTTGVLEGVPTPDGQRLVLHLANGLFGVTTINGGPVQQVSAGPEGGQFIMFSSESGRFYFTAANGTPHSLPLGPFPPTNSTAIAFSAEYLFDRQALYQEAFQEFYRTFGAGFYDPTMHGVNWKALRAKYETLLPGVGTPEEFAGLLLNMVGEVNSSHSEISPSGSSGGAGPDQPTLGIVYDYDYAGPGLRVSAIMPKSPADRPASRINVGEYVLSIDGTDVAMNESYYRTIQNKTGKPVELLVNSKPTKDGARTVKLAPISMGQFAELDYDARVKHTREMVDKLSGGRLAYIHIRAMDEPSLESFERELWSDAIQKDGLVLDIRGNPGGNTHDAILQTLSRKVYEYIQSRDGFRETQPTRVWNKPIVLLINENSFSDAEVFPTGFRALHLGKIVGVPTPGYVIGTYEATLVDGTHYRIPTTGFYTVDGKSLENLGIQPDIYVENTPEDSAKHRDRQLEAAVEILLKEAPTPSPGDKINFTGANSNSNGGSSYAHPGSK